MFVEGRVTSSKLIQVIAEKIRTMVFQNGFKDQAKMNQLASQDSFLLLFHDKLEGPLAPLGKESLLVQSSLLENTSNTG